MGVSQRKGGLHECEAVRDFDSAPPCVGEDGYGTGRKTTPEIDDPLRAVPAKDEHAIAVRHVEGSKLACLGGDGAAQVGKREHAIALDDVRPRAPAARESEQAFDTSRTLRVHAVRHAVQRFDGDLIAPTFCCR
jgi:hypothetical protein